MIDPYRMVFINVALSIILLLGILVYRLRYPKRKINLFVLLLIISLLPLVSLLRPGDYESGDFNIHIYRIMSFYSSLKEGIWLPSWAAELNATYGYPLFIFNYTLPYYVISFLHFLGISFIVSMKIYLGLTFFLSGIGMYLWINTLIKNKLAAFSAALFYLFAPYHLIDVHFRATVGESTVFTLAPFVFYSVTKFLQEKKSIFWVLTILFMGLLFLAHSLLAGIFLGIAICFILIFGKIKDQLKFFASITLALLNGALISIYAWAPFLIYSPFTLQQKMTVTQNLGFYPFNQIFYSPWHYGLLFQGPNGELALLIGYTQLIVLLGSLIVIMKKIIPKKTVTPFLFWTTLSFLFIFLMHPSSGIFWKNFLFLQPLLPTGRLSLIISFCISVLVGYFVLVLLSRKIKIHFIYLLLIITVGSTMLNWGHRRVISAIGDQELQNNVALSTAQGEGHFYANSQFRDPKDPWFSELPKNHLEIVQGSGEIKEIDRRSTNHKYIVNANSSLTLKESTLFFPGWQVYTDKKLTPIGHDKQGLIMFTLTKGLHYIEVVYKDIFIYKVLKIISIVTFSITTAYIFFKLPFHFPKNSKRIPG